jgi:hypothetical protein
MSEGNVERRVLAKLVARWIGSTRAVFELADGSQVELEGPVEFDSPESPAPGEKAFVVVNEVGLPVRWLKRGSAGTAEIGSVAVTTNARALVVVHLTAI